MKKYLFMLVLGMLMLTGCATTKVMTNVSREALERAGLAGAPDWVLNNGTGFETAVGTAPIIDKDVTAAVAKATDNARIELAKYYAMDISGDAKKPDDIKMIIGGTKITQSKSTKIWIDRTGTRVYVLLEMKPEDHRY